MYNKMIDITNIFNLFSKDEDLEGVTTTKSLNELKTSPIYYVGMWKKLVLNHINFNTKVLKFFQSTNQEFDIKDIKEAGEYVVFNRAWSYVTNIDLTNQKHIDAIKHYSDEQFITSLDLGIEYFQKDELYERCALLLKIKKKSIKLQK
tara:strand:+ start:82 stop:525 length:444 start_codon:yes stop_codon:yes gene_type:complete